MTMENTTYYFQPKFTEISKTDRILSVILIFCSSTLIAYCIFIFGPLFIASRRRGHSDVSTEMVDFTITHQLIFIIISIAIGFLFSFIYISKKSTTELVKRIQFDQNAKEIELTLINFLTGNTRIYKIPYALLYVKIEKSYDGNWLDELKVVMMNNNYPKIRTQMSNQDYIWENEPILLRLVMLHLKNVSNSYLEDKKPSWNQNIGEQFFK